MDKKGQVFNTDVLVVGGGMAGCMAAIKSRELGASTILVDKGYVSSSGQTPYADSFCIFDEELGDNMDDWLAIIAKGGDYLNNVDWSRKVLEGTKELYEDLSSYGIKFDTFEDGSLRRIDIGTKPLVTAFLKDKKHSCMTLRKQVLKSGATIMDRLMITDLIKKDGVICGAVGMSVSEANFYIIHAKAVILTTGASCFLCLWSFCFQPGKVFLLNCVCVLTGFIAQLACFVVECFLLVPQV